ncbi:MAG: SLC13 family permease [Hyphomicrobiales bacterium]|nr:MAG: SLC13 family permease [Hyphomicrobiales bacterium]
MTIDQALAFGLVFATVVGFIWGRLPYDLVAVAALFAGLVLGIVPFDQAFTGFSDNVVVIVAGALIISSAVARSGFVEDLMRPLLPYMKSARSQVPILVGATMLMSMVTKNVGALAIFMPVAAQVAKRSGTSISRFLMPMSFASLIGGLVTLVGTSPNIIVSKIRVDVSGKPFGMFDYAPVGLGVALAGFIFLSLASGLLPKRKPGGTVSASFNLDAYTVEAVIPEGSASASRTIGEIEALGDGDIRIRWVIRERFRRLVPSPDMPVRGGDVLLIAGDPEDLERAIARSELRLAGETIIAAADVETETVVEAIVSPASSVIGLPVVRGIMQQHPEVAVLAISRGGQPISQRLSSLKLRANDVVVLKGTGDDISQALGALNLLPLAERRIVLGRNRRSYVPIAVLAIAMALTAAGVASAAVAFFGAAVTLLLLRVMSMSDAYHSVEASVIVLLAALIPISEAIQTTGGTDLIAAWLSPLLSGLAPSLALAVVIILAMAVTPFLNNAATVLMMAPIAASVAIKLGLNPDPFLMGVALGAACDFLTPIGHQCNTIVMGPGGYKFGDYWRLGLPLSVIVVVCGTLLITLVWPF